jgi:hypothetical protein
MAASMPGGSGAAEVIECGQQIHVHLDVTAQPAGAGQGALVGDQDRQRRGITTCSRSFIASWWIIGVMTHSPTPYYAEVFAPMPGRCCRFISRGGQGPDRCPESPTWRGTFRGRNGRRYTVDACEGHRPRSDHDGGAGRPR